MSGRKHPARGSVTPAMHAQAQARKVPITSYAPIAHALLMLDDSE